MSETVTVPRKSFGKAVRLASVHRFKSETSRVEAGDQAYVVGRRRMRIASFIGHAIAVVVFVGLSGWVGKTIGAALIAPLGGVTQAASLFGAVLLTFMGAFGFMRLGQAAVRALFDEDDISEWPRKGVDWGRQTVVLDRDGIAMAMRFVRRGYPWDTLAQLTEDDVFIIDRKQGAQIVIPKDSADEDDMRERLFRGLTLSNRVE